MNAINIADKLVSAGRVFVLSALIALPLNAQAEYYLVYGPAAPVCDYCQTKRVYYRPVHKVKVHKVKAYSHRKPCYKRVYHRRSHYNITVYYPVPVCARASCGGCCDGFMEPTYYWAPAPYRVYYAQPEDRIVGNRYEANYYDPSLDTGTADNDIY